MKTEEEIMEFLARKLPDGPETSEEMGVQAALDWVLGGTDEPL